MPPCLCRFHPRGASCPQTEGWVLHALPKDQGEAGRRLTQVLVRPKLLPGLDDSPILPHRVRVTSCCSEPWSRVLHPSQPHPLRGVTGFGQ